MTRLLHLLFALAFLYPSGLGVFRKLGKVPPPPRHFLSSSTTAERVEKSSAFGSRTSSESRSRLAREGPERTSLTPRTGGKGVRFVPFKLETAELIVLHTVCLLCLLGHHIDGQKSVSMVTGVLQNKPAECLATLHRRIEKGPST